jgi:hypothetical protein
MSKYAENMANGDGIAVRNTAELETFLSSLDSYDDVHSEMYESRVSDTLQKYRLSWHREDLDVIKRTLRNVRVQINILRTKEDLAYQRLSVVDALIDKLSVFPFTNTDPLAHDFKKSYYNLKDEQDALNIEAFNFGPAAQLENVYGELILEQCIKRPGLDKPWYIPSFFHLKNIQRD